jgi:hypothetical protein
MDTPRMTRKYTYVFVDILCLRRRKFQGRSARNNRSKPCSENCRPDNAAGSSWRPSIGNRR